VLVTEAVLERGLTLAEKVLLVNDVLPMAEFEVEEGLKDVGERRNLRAQDREAVAADAVEPLARSCVRRLGWRGRLLISVGSREGSMGSKDTSGKVSNSRSSLIVNAAC